MATLDLKIVQQLVPSSKYGIKCPYAMTPQGITIHNTANDASAQNEIAYMTNNDQEVSYHYAVDDVEAIQGLPLDRNGWHAGDGGNGKGNRTTIAIEICHSLTKGNPRYAKSEDNGAKLAAIILHQYGWGIDRIRKHQDWSGKYCPHRILDNGNWEGFKSKVQQYLNQLKGTPTPTPTPKPVVTAKPTAVASVKEYTEYGTFTATENIYFRNEPNLNGRTQGMYYVGESVNYDRVRIDVNGFVWISWVSASTGIRRWMPTGETKNGKRSGSAWGTFK